MRPHLGCACVVLVLGCAPPHQNVPNVGNVIGSFRQARDSCHDYAGIAKTRVVLPRRLQEGQDLYAEAKGSHNKAITSIIVAISADKLMSKDDLTDLLEKADADRKKFVAWYKMVLGRRQSHVAENEPTSNEVTTSIAPMEVMVTLADLVVELLKLQESRFAEQRAELREELRKCEWDDWEDVGSTTEAESPAR